MKRLPALAALLLVLSACRPVLAIGWGELVVIGVVIALLLGPLLMRFVRALEKYRGTKKD